eukprot:388771-Karenia_brevis.AAC.1
MGKFDDSVLLDDTRAGWLGKAMMLHVKTRRRELLSRGLVVDQLSDQPMWDFGSKEILEDVRRIAARQQTLWMFESLYVLRHGGASRDALMKLRSLPEIQRRGRWSSLDSVKHYEKHARTQSHLHQIPRSTLDYGLRSRTTFNTLLQK